MGSVAMEVLKQTPLVRYARFETFDLDEARVEVARVFCPHTLTARGVQQASAFHNSVNLGGHNSVNLGGMTLNYMRYGIDIRINPGEMKNFYLLQIPVVGTARIHSGSHAVDASTMVARCCRRLCLSKWTGLQTAKSFWSRSIGDAWNAPLNPCWAGG